MQSSHVFQGFYDLLPKSLSSKHHIYLHLGLLIPFEAFNTVASTERRGASVDCSRRHPINSTVALVLWTVPRHQVARDVTSGMPNVL